MSCYTSDIDHVAPMLDELSEIRNGRYKCATCIDCAADFIARHVLLDVISGKDSVIIIAKENMTPNVIGTSANVIGVSPNVIGTSPILSIGWYLDGHLIARTAPVNGESISDLRESTMHRVLSLLNRVVVTFKCAAQGMEYVVCISPVADHQ